MEKLTELYNEAAELHYIIDGMTHSHNLTKEEIISRNAERLRLKDYLLDVEFEIKKERSKKEHKTKHRGDDKLATKV